MHFQSIPNSKEDNIQNDSGNNVIQNSHESKIIPVLTLLSGVLKRRGGRKER